MQLIARPAPLRDQGFTLVELMVTIALLSVLLMAVLPDIGSWQRNLQVRNITSSIQAGLDKAREEAVRRNRVVRFSLVTVDDPASLDDSCELSGAGSSWVVSLLDPEGKCGEGKCGGDKGAEGKCGGDKAEKEGKCGEGKCGDSY